jgi:hypothetical protein
VVRIFLGARAGARGPSEAEELAEAIRATRAAFGSTFGPTGDSAGRGPHEVKVREVNTSATGGTGFLNVIRIDGDGSASDGEQLKSLVLFLYHSELGIDRESCIRRLIDRSGVCFVRGYACPRLVVVSNRVAVSDRGDKWSAGGLAIALGGLPNPSRSLVWLERPGRRAAYFTADNNRQGAGAICRHRPDPTRSSRVL